jgi:hypothetical protein
MPGKNILEGSMWLAQQPAMRSQNVLMFPSELPSQVNAQKLAGSIVTQLSGGQHYELPIYG